jgi:hypothetical protein
MTITVVKIVPTTNLTTSSVSYSGTIGTGVKQIVKRAIFSNYSAGSVTITVNVVASGGSASTANQVINARAFVSPELSGLTLIAGDQIFALASANSSVNITVSGIQVT